MRNRALEQIIKVGDLLYRARFEVCELEAQRDELLAACEAMKHALQAVEDSNCYKYDLDEIIRLGRTTIAKVRQ